MTVRAAITAQLMTRGSRVPEETTLRLMRLEVTRVVKTFLSDNVPAQQDKRHEAAPRALLTETFIKQGMNLSGRLDVTYSPARATVMVAMNVQPVERS